MSIGITRVNDDLLKNLTGDNNINFGATIDQNLLSVALIICRIVEGNELIGKFRGSPKIVANISINREDHEPVRFELDQQNLSKTSSTGG